MEYGGKLGSSKRGACEKREASIIIGLILLKGCGKNGSMGERCGESASIRPRGSEDGKAIQPHRSYVVEADVAGNHRESNIFVQGEQERLSDNLHLTLCRDLDNSGFFLTYPLSDVATHPSTRFLNKHQTREKRL